MAKVPSSPRSLRFLLTAASVLALALTACDSGSPATEADAATAEGATAGGGEMIIYEASDASMLDDPNYVSDSKAFFSYVDANGGDHLVQGLHNVPSAYQQLARNLSNGNTRTINRYNGAATVRKASAVVASSTGVNRNNLDITLYSAEWCGACKRAKQLLDSEGVDYVLRDIDDDPGAREQVKLVLGKVRIPLIDINGEYVTGYNRDTIMNLIQGS